MIPLLSHIVLVPKLDGTSRFCIDYRSVNKVTVIDPYPVLRIDEIIDDIDNASYISTFDLTRGYWQIRLTEGARQKSAHYEMNVMHFGM